MPPYPVYLNGVLIRYLLEDLPALRVPLHLAIGVFDGVHVGHQAVIERAVAAAVQQGGLAGVITFDPHPIQVIAPGKAPAALLETLEHKARVVSDLGVQLFVPLRFDIDFSKLEAGEFLKRITAAPVRTIAVGEDWRFGHHRAGDATLLLAEASSHGYTLEAVAPVMHDGERISSSRIRQAIRDGNLEAAQQMLGRPYTIAGKVLEGRQLGRTLGFPTANLATGSLQLPPEGVWAIRARLEDNRLLPGVANLGLRPTVGGHDRLLEVHLFDFSDNLYGKALEIHFEKRLRGEIQFPSLEALTLQIERDCQEARAIL